MSESVHDEQQKFRHPVRGPEWDFAESKYADLMTALDNYRLALVAAGARSDSVVVEHLVAAASRLERARP